MKSPDPLPSAKKTPLPENRAGFIRPPAAFSSRDWMALGLIVTLALAVRMAYYLSVRHELWFANPIIDSWNYHHWAKAILAGDILGKDVFVHSPLYAFFLALLYAVLGPKPDLAAGVQLVMGALSCGLVFLLGRRVFDRTVGAVAAAMAAVYGVAIFHEGTLLTVILIHMLNLGVLLTAYWAAGREKWQSWIWTGLLLGLSVLTRPNILLLALILLSWLWMMYQGHWKKMAGPAVALCLCTAVVVLPATLRNMAVLHEMLLTVGNGGINFYLGNARDSRGVHVPFRELGLSASQQVQDFKAEAEKRLKRKLTYGQSSRYWSGQAWKDILADPLRWQRLLVDKLLFFLNDYEYTTSLHYYGVREITPFLKWPWLFFGFVGPFALLGMIFAVRQWKFLWPLYGLVLVYAFSNISMLVSSEYRFAVMPAFFVFAALAMKQWFGYLRQKNWPQVMVTLCLLLLFGLLANVDVLGRELRAYHLATAHANFGNLLSRLEYYQQASEEYGMAKELLENKPENKAWLALKQGQALMDGGEYDQAQQALDEAYSLSSEDPEVIDSLATALTANQRYQQAIELRKKAISIEPGNAVYYYNLGITCLWANLDAEAEPAFRKAQELDPKLSGEIAKKREEIRSKRR